MAFPERLKSARLAAGMTQQQVADAMGITNSTYCGYETGRREPDIKKIKLLAKIFNTSGDILLDIGYNDAESINQFFNLTIDEKEHIKKYCLLDRYGKEAVDTILNIEYNRCMDDLNNTEPEDPVIYLPHPIQPASAGSGLYTDDDDADQVEVVYNSFTSKADFILTVSGDSMEPAFSDGDWVLVRSQPAVEIGEIGVYFIGGSQYIKEYRGTYLHSLNPKYDDVPCDDDTVCRGKVIGLLDESWIQ